MGNKEVNYTDLIEKKIQIYNLEKQKRYLILSIGTDRGEVNMQKQTIIT